MRHLWLLLIFLCVQRAVWAGPLPSTELPADAGPWVVRAYFVAKSQLNLLARRSAPWEVRHDQAYAVIEVANRFEYAQLLAGGFRVAIDPALSGFLRNPPGGLRSVPGYGCYRTVEETETSMDALLLAHPTLATIIDIGDSWTKIHGPSSGYDLRVLKLSNSAVVGPKPILFVMGAIHAREYTTAETVMRFAENLLSRYALDADVRWMLDHHELHILPHANPDARKQAELGLLWRKNVNANYCLGTPSQRGADLNRNFPFEWGAHSGSSGESCDSNFRGISAASEPETAAIAAYLASIFPDVRPPDLVSPAPSNNPGVFMDVHSFGRLVLWPWSFSTIPAPNGPAMATLGRRLAWFNDYRPQPGIDLYVTDGGTKEFAYGELGVAALSLELGDAFFESCANFEGAVLDNNLRALEYLLRSARRPYQEPSGPSLTERLSAPVEIGEPIRLFGIATDLDFNNVNGIEATQNISQVDAYVDNLPWLAAPPSAQAIAIDGAFNTPTETWSVELPSSGMTLGSHRIFLRGSDTAGSGPNYARDVEVAPIGSTARVQGAIRDANSGARLSVPAWVRLGDYGTLGLPSERNYALRAAPGTYTLKVSAAGYVDAQINGLLLTAASTVRQDVTLLPICTVFSDTASAGLGNFIAQVPWGIESSRFFSGPAAFSDSPGGDYGANADISLSTLALDLRDVANLRLGFQSYCDTEAGWDFGRVEISTDGNTWNEIWRCDANASWQKIDLDLSALNNQQNARLRFRLSSDGGFQREGWSIDDLVINGSGPICTIIFDTVFANGFE